MEPHDMIDAVSASLERRTGKTLEQWTALVEAEGPDPLDQKAVRAFLKERGVAQNSQWAIADALARRHGWTAPTAQEYAAQLYRGAKAGLRPLHDAVVAYALGLGDDVELQGRSTYLPLVRRTQFMAVAPGPRGTVRVGFRFRGEPPHVDGLEPAKGFAQATHWLHIPGDADPRDIPARIAEAARQAYADNG